MKLIAGIDPGATIGWAAFDLQGRLVSSGSQKGLDRSAIISKLMQLGRVIAIGTDKAKIPSLVDEVATRLGAVVVSPPKDIRVDEKRSMTGNFESGSSHEMDAVASAIVAMRKFQPLLNKILSFLEKEKRLGLFEDVAELVIKDEISIRTAVDILTPKEKPLEAPIEELKRDEELTRIYSLFSRARKDAAILSSKNKALESEVFSLKQQLKSIQNKASSLVKPKTPADIAKIKDAQIQSLAQRLRNSLQMQSRLSLLVERLETMLLHQDKIPLLRLARIGWEDVMKNSSLIVEGSVLYFDDANEISDKAVAWLCQKGVQVIVCGRLPSHRARASLPFACVPAEECELIGKIALVKKEWLEKIRAEREVLSKIVDEYKKARSPDWPQ
jgi:hypothetical protein